MTTKLPIKFAFDLLFFNDRKVLDWVDARQAKAMNRVGATIRTIDRRSIRKASKAYIGQKRKAGGNPPRWRRRGQCTLKDGIFYAFDTRKSELVEGAILCRSGNTKARGQTFPQEIEFGSTQSQPFPHSGPALEKALARDEVRKSLEAF